MLYLFSLRAKKDPKLDHRPTPDAGVFWFTVFTHSACASIDFFFV